MSTTKGALATTTALPTALPLRDEVQWRRRASVMSLSSIASRRSSLKSIFSVNSSNPDGPGPMRGPGSPEVLTFQDAEPPVQGRRKSYVPKYAAESFVNSTTLVAPAPSKSTPSSPLKSGFPPIAVKDHNGLWNVDSPRDSETEVKEKKKLYRKSYSNTYGYDRLVPRDDGPAEL